VLSGLPLTIRQRSGPRHEQPEAAEALRPTALADAGGGTEVFNGELPVDPQSAYPQFIPAGESVLAWTAALAGLQVAVETVLYVALAFAVGRASGWFRRPRIRRRLEAISGTVLIALGVRVATAPRLILGREQVGSADRGLVAEG
jgi:threonine/homoserine/homoserine lactone efflux protein